MNANRVMIVAGILILAAAFGAGCSRETATQPVMDDAVLMSASAIAGEAQFIAQVRTTNEAQRMLTFQERPEIVVAYQNCKVVRMQNGQESPAGFGDIHPGDTVKVFGEPGQYNYVYAYRLQIQYQTPENYQFAARVQTTDQNRMTITFQERPDTVIALQHCEFARQCFGFQFRVQFSDIQAGDSVQVQGEKHQDGYLYAHRVQVCTTDPGGRWDISFKDTITTIDYTLGTFTVTNRSELITTDENTKIWGVTEVIVPPSDNGRNGGSGASLGDPDGSGRHLTDTALQFTDLVVGDVVTVHAMFVDETTLLTTCIRLTDCGEIKKKCVEFVDQLASVDPDTRVVTFVGQGWTGDVCNGAQLIGLSGEELTLADFTAGETVAVKGLPMTEDTLRISRMEKVPTP
jgi:hypothetical protein